MGDALRSRGAARLGLAVFLLGATGLLAVLAWTPMSNNDIWLHLKVGETILAEGRVPTAERFSFTAAGRPLVPHEWGAAVLFALVHRAFGVEGLIAFKALLAAAAFAAALGAARGMGARLPVAAAPLALVMVLVSARLLERPHLWSYLLAAIFLLLLDRHRRRRGRLLWLLLPLQAAWANLHGGFVLGWLLTAAYLGAAGLAAWRSSGSPFRLDRGGRRLLAVAAALPLVCLLNPVGYRLLAFPFHLTGNPLFMASVYEWLPTFHPVYRGSYMFREYLALTLLFALLALLRLRGRARACLGAACLACAAAIGIGSTPLLLGGAALAAAALVLGRGAVPVAPGIAVAALFLLSTRMNRNVSDFALLALPPTAGLLDREIRRRAGALDRALRRAPAIAAAVAGAGLALLSLRIAVAGYWYSPTSRRAAGAGVASVPVEAVEFLAAERVGGRLFASYNAASYAIYRLYPRVRVFLDSRNEAYPEALFQEYLDSLAGGAALDGTLDRHGVDMVLLTLRPNPPLAMAEALDARPDFALVYFDDRAAVWVRDLPPFADLIARRGYRFLSPLSVGRRRIDAASAGAVAGEARRALADCTQCLVARGALGEAAFVRGDLDDARRIFADLAAASPDLYLARIRLGDILALQGDGPGALAQYREALRLSPGDAYASAQMQAVSRDGRIRTYAILEPTRPAAPAPAAPAAQP